MATTKKPLFIALTGDVVAGAGDNSFEITDPTFFKTLKIEGLAEDDHLDLVRENYAGDGWVPATDGRNAIQIHRGNTSVTPVHIGKYALQGKLAGTGTAYTEEYP